MSDDPILKAQILSRLAALARKGGEDFFSEPGVPEDLRQGWAVYQKRVADREVVGFPLPPGGCLILGRESVVAGCMAELHNMLAGTLRIPVGRIRLRLERSDAGGWTPVADVDIPKGWIEVLLQDTPQAQLPKKQTEEELQRFMSMYLESTLAMGQEWFSRTLAERLRACDTIRPELAQPVLPWKHDGKK